MVKKLLKYEFKYYLRIIIFILPVILSVGIAFRLLLAFPNESVFYQILVFLFYSLMMFTFGASTLFVSILGIIRFYKNLYGTEGYLTFTLPVSNKQHLFVKAFTSIVCDFIVILVNLLSFGIVLTAIPQHFGWDWMFVVVQKIIQEPSYLHIFAFIFEFNIWLVVISISNTGIVYLCMSIGQLVNKNRILLSIGAYYAHGIVLEIIYSIIYFIVAFMAIFGLFELIINFIDAHPFLSIHVILNTGIAISAGCAVLYYSLVLKIMNNRLNLE